jgi:flagellar hook-length control protein FliK
MNVPVNILTQAFPDQPVAKDKTSGDVSDSESTNKDASAQQLFLPMLTQMMHAGGAPEAHATSEVGHDGGKNAAGNDTQPAGSIVDAAIKGMAAAKVLSPENSILPMVNNGPIQASSSGHALVDVAGKNTAGATKNEALAQGIVSGSHETLTKLAEKVLGGRVVPAAIQLTKENMESLEEGRGTADGASALPTAGTPQSGLVKIAEESQVLSASATSDETNAILAQATSRPGIAAEFSEAFPLNEGNGATDRSAAQEGSATSKQLASSRETLQQKHMASETSSVAHSKTQVPAPAKLTVNKLEQTAAESSQDAQRALKNELVKQQVKMPDAPQKDGITSTADRVGASRMESEGSRANISADAHEAAGVTARVDEGQATAAVTMHAIEHSNTQRSDQENSGNPHQQTQQEPDGSSSGGHASTGTHDDLPGGTITAKNVSHSPANNPASVSSAQGPQSTVSTLASHSQLLQGKTDGLQVGAKFDSLPPELSRSVVTQIAQELHLHTQENFSEIKVMLKPESLGEVFLKVKMEDGRMTAQIDVNQANVKVALESQLPQLREVLIARGIDIEHINIVANGEAWARESNKEHGEKARQQSKRRVVSDPIERYEGARLMGYNTVEYIM